MAKGAVYNPETGQFVEVDETPEELAARQLRLAKHRRRQLSAIPLASMNTYWKQPKGLSTWNSNRF